MLYCPRTREDHEEAAPQYVENGPCGGNLLVDRCSIVRHDQETGSSEAFGLSKGVLCGGLQVPEDLKM